MVRSETPGFKTPKRGRPPDHIRVLRRRPAPFLRRSARSALEPAAPKCSCSRRHGLGGSPVNSFQLLEGFRLVLRSRYLIAVTTWLRSKRPSPRSWPLNASYMIYCFVDANEYHRIMNFLYRIYRMVRVGTARFLGALAWLSVLGFVTFGSGGCGPLDEGSASPLGRMPSEEDSALPTSPEHVRPRVSFMTLLSEMTDRDRLAVHPRAGTPHRLVQASSYERASTRPGRRAWFANRDWSWYIREERNQGRREWVLLDARGPGAVTRFWLTNGTPNQRGTLRFYLDGSRTPFWAGRAGRSVGQNRAIGRPLSSRSFERDRLNGGAKPGYNLYAPIPYQKRLKVTYDVPPVHRNTQTALWYGINYRKYGSSTVVQSFNPRALSNRAVARKLARTNAQLRSPDTAPRGAGNRRLRRVRRLNPGQALEQPLRGTGAVRRLRLKLRARNQAAALEQTLLELVFDRQQTARVPVGHFFGTGSKRLNALKEWYRTVDRGTGQMTVYWTMPYRTNGSVRVINGGRQPVQAELEVETGAWKWTRDSMHFHAGYRQQRLQTVRRRGQDWNYVTIRGRGVYVGDTLEVSKAIGGWWGEGDEKIYVDGEAFPSHFGTGTEDYYGYAWGHRETFSLPFISQPLAGANYMNRAGTTVNSRTRALDGIPFNRSLKVDMEVWNWHGGPVDYSVATFWYKVPGS